MCNVFISRNNFKLKATGISIAPNPTSEYLRISADELIVKLGVYNLQGKLIVQEEPNSRLSEIYISELEGKGVYIIRIATEHNVRNLKAVFE